MNRRALVPAASVTGVLVLVASVLYATTGTSANPVASRTSSVDTTPPGPATGSGVTTWSGPAISPTAIPLGDHRVSTVPTVGSTDSCLTTFRNARGRGADPWIDTASGTWNLDRKLQVEGHHTWPAAEHSFTVRGASRVLQTDDLPEGKGQTTGTFPISPSDPAYRYDRNPNAVAAQDFTWTVAAEPTAAASPSCVPMGPIGVATNGVVLFNALDASGRDAGAHEVQDSCDGHPQSSEIYHYHDFSACLDTAATRRAGSSTLVGYALDGYGIYVERDSHGNLPSNADLDACHGRTSRVLFDGREQVVYHYDVTLEYPYFLGCFHGTPHLQSSTGTLRGRAVGQGRPAGATSPASPAGGRTSTGVSPGVATPTGGPGDGPGNGPGGTSSAGGGGSTGRGPPTGIT